MRRTSFDRVAGIYDQTRGHPPQISPQIASTLAGLVQPGARLLEVGVGTGRIARPLLAEGLNVWGVDISQSMLHRLVEQLPPGAAAPPLTLADATQLPFAGQSFDGVLFVHLIHLIEDWRAALDEFIRLLKPGGAIFSGYDHRAPDSPLSLTNEEWRRIMGEYVDLSSHRSPREFNEVIEYLLERGAKYQACQAAAWEVSFIPDDYIREMESGYYSSTWRLDPAMLPVCAERLRAWARRQFGRLDSEFMIPRKFVWEKFSWGVS